MKIEYVGIPENLNLPFFTYGIFKPGQLSYHRIEKYVKSEPIMGIIKHETYYRDGIALIVDEENEIFKTTGYLIEFTNPQNAYNIIGNSIPEKLYKWKKIKINDREANALVGVEANLGSFDNRDYDISTYDYRKDSFFNEALELIEDIINEFKDKNITSMRDFYILQMHYMLLWSIIERFCTLSHGYFKIGLNMFKFARKESFKDVLGTIQREDTIYSSDKLEEKNLDPEKYWESIKYYYTIRCNVVHKGKSVKRDDMNKLKYSLEELYGLFMVVYNEELKQNNEIWEKYPERPV